MNRTRTRHRASIVYRPFHSEQKKLYKSLGYRTVLRCGRRFGKTTLLEQAAGNWASKGKSVGWFSPAYKLLSPSYKRIRALVSPIVAYSSKTDGIIELETGGQIEFWTLNNEDAGRSRSYDWVIIDEAGLMLTGLKDIWEQAIAPTLLDRDGSAVMAGTPKGIDPENYFYEACTSPDAGWTEHHRPTSANPHLNQEAVAKLKRDYAPLVYQQEFLAEFVDWSGVAFFSRDSLLVDGQPVEYPRVCTSVVAIIDTAVKTGTDNDGTGVSYWAVSQTGGIPLICLDWDYVQVEGAMLEVWIPSVFARLEELAKECRPQYGSAGAYIEDAQSGSILLQQCAARNLPATALPAKLTSAGKDARAINASGPVYRGDVKFSRHAFEKTTTFKRQTRNHMLTQVVEFRIGDKDAAKRADDLLDTFTYAVAITLGDSAGIA